MSKLLFGTGGTPHSSSSSSAILGIQRIAELGLGCMELEFVQGVRMGEKLAVEVGDTAFRLGIKLTAHAPYFINLNSHEPEKVRASQNRLLQTARIASICKAESIIFHAAFYLGDPPEDTYNTVKKHLEEILQELKELGIRIWIRPEIMGKSTQFGTMEEILKLSNELEGIAPGIDFTHLHARNGKFNSYPEFASILEQIQKNLGSAALDNMHIHVSGIAYSSKGEKNHLNLEESDFRFTELLKALKDYEAKGVVICESPNLEEDALLLQKTYRNLSKTASM